MWKIPLFDTNFGEPERVAVDGVIRSGWLTMGDKVAEFETRFAEFLGVQHAIAVSSCTAALHLCNEALNIGPGDEVICPSITFVAGANTIMQTGATPVFADIASPSDFGLSADDVEQKVTPHTKAVQVVHYAGAPCDMIRILEIAKRHNLSVIEDCAHAPGAVLDGEMCGTIGDLGCFSFFSNKNLAIGEGGMVTTDDDDLAATIRQMRSHGMTSVTLDRHRGRANSYDVVEKGFNYRLDEIRGALGIVQLGRLPDANQQRRRVFDRYRNNLASLNGIDVVAPGATERSACHISPTMLAPDIDRGSFMTAMSERGVQTSIHYPPSHLFKHYRETLHCGPGDLPKSEDVGRREVTLPLYPALENEDVDFVCETVAEALVA